MLLFFPLSALEVFRFVLLAEQCSTCGFTDQQIEVDISGASGELELFPAVCFSDPLCLYNSPLTQTSIPGAPCGALCTLQSGRPLS